MASLPFQSLLMKIFAERTDPEKAPEPETVTSKARQGRAEIGSEEITEEESDELVLIDDQVITNDATSGDRRR